MKIHMSHQFTVTPAEFMALLDDPEFEALLATESNMSRDITEKRTNPDGTSYKRTRCRPNREVPGWLQKVIGKDGLVWDQVNETDPKAGVLKWSIEIPKLADRVTVGGTTTYEARDGGCLRTLDGDVTVKVRFIGGQIEKFVAAEVEKGFDKTARAIMKFIAAKG